MNESVVHYSPNVNADVAFCGAKMTTSVYDFTLSSKFTLVTCKRCNQRGAAMILLGSIQTAPMLGTIT